MPAPNAELRLRLWRVSWEKRGKEKTNRRDFHNGKLLRCRHIFLFMNRMFYSLQKCALRLAFHPL